MTPPAHIQTATDAVNTLTQHFGPAAAEEVIRDALCEQRVDEPTPWMSDDDLLTVEHATTLHYLARRTELLGSIPDLHPQHLQRLVGEADAIVLTDPCTQPTLDVLDWLDRGLILASQSNPAPAHWWEVEVGPGGIISGRRESRPGRHEFGDAVLVATIYSGAGHEALWLVWVPDEALPTTTVTVPLTGQSR